MGGRPGACTTIARFVLLSAVVACGHAPGTAPEDMGAAEHDDAAERQERAAWAHDAAPKGADRCTGDETVVCWSSISDPTAEHVREAARARELAARHRAASRSLREVEARACAGVPAADREVSPFAHVEDIRSVADLQETRMLGKVATTRTTGAEVTFRAVPGMTAEWLQRLVDCHVARNGVIGYAQTTRAMPRCPLAVADVQTEVRSVGDGFTVAIRSDDRDTAEEILRRAKALIGATPGQAMGRAGQREAT